MNALGVLGATWKERLTTVGIACDTKPLTEEQLANQISPIAGTFMALHSARECPRDRLICLGCVAKAERACLYHDF